MSRTSASAPKTRCNGTMTEAQYLSWIRSALRSKSLKWPPRAKAIELARRPYKGPNKLQKWEVQCALCKQWWKLKEVEVDHYPIEAGSIPNVQAIGEFCNNLYCETDNLRVLCIECHATHTFTQKHKCSWDDAKKLQRIHAVIKNNTIPQLTKKLKALGYTDSELSNADKRKKAVEDVIRNGGIIE